MLKTQKSNRTVFFYVLLVLGFLLVVFCNVRNLYDPDTFWHIKTGEYIFKNRAIPTQDIFSWYGIEHNLKWINHEWLYDLFLYLIYLVGGVKGVTLLSPIAAGCLYILIYKLVKIRSNNEYMAFGIALISGYYLYGFLNPRPQIISYMLLLVLMIAYEKGIWWAGIPIMILGVNLHGGFYVIYVGITCYYLWRKKPLAVVLTWLCAIINPYTFEMILYPFKIQQYPYFSEYIAEWQHVVLFDYKAELVMYVLLVISLIGQKIHWEDGLISIVLAVMTLSANRHVVLLYLIILPVLSPYITEGIKEKIIHITKYLPSRYRQALTIRLVSLIIIPVLTMTVTYYLVVAKNTAGGIEEELYPVKVVAFLKENKLTERIFNMYSDGGFFIYNGIKPMIDGRADIFVPYYNNTDLYKEYCLASTGKISFIEFLKKYNIKTAVIKKDFVLYRVIRDNPLYKTIYEDNNYVVVSI